MLIRLYYTFFVLVLTAAMQCTCFGQSLSRKVFLGIRMETLTDDAKRIMGANIEGGVLIVEVFEESTAEKAGFKKGDILLSLDEKQVSSTPDVIDALKGKKAGERFSWQVHRDKETLKGTAIFQPMPQEQYEGLDVIYTHAQTALGTERMIMTRLKGTARQPAIVFIGGVGCYSLDFPFDSTRSEVQLLNALSRNGYTCVRAEKPGVGDNYATKPCSEVSFAEEADSYVAMIEALKRRPDIDSHAIYIFGHSMGGVFAPLIAQKTNIRGIMAYGTIGSNFLEYLMKTRKTIAEAYNMDPVESDGLVKNFCECAVYYFTDSMTSREAEEKKPGCGELLSVFDLRSRAYNNELYSISIPELWSTYDGKVLLLWGTADYISSQEDHEMIKAAVNYYHKDNATFKTIKNADHGMLMAASFAEAGTNPGTYNNEVGRTVLSWLNEQ